jgi:hypothetical protein
VTAGEPGMTGPGGGQNQAVRQELAAIYARLAGMQAEARGAMSPRLLVLAYATSVVAFVLLLLAAVSVLGGIQDHDAAAGIAASVILGGAGLVLAVLAGRLFRRLFRPVLAVGGERDRLLARRRELIAALAGTGAMPADRHPTAWATAMHARFPVGRAPAEVLRTMPPDAPAWRTWLSRNIGWGAATALLLLAAVILVGTIGAILIAG